MKKKLGYEEPAIRTLLERGKSGAPDRTYEARANIVNLPNGYDKQEINPKRLELVKIRGEDDRDADKGKAAAEQAHLG